jgi:phenylacetate-CoA ligase
MGMSACAKDAWRRHGEALRRTLDAARSAPFNRERLPAPPDGAIEPAFWRQLPLLRKSDLRRAYPFGLLAVAQRQLASYHESSGTTGEPTSSYFTEDDWEDIASRFVRNGVDLGPDDCVLVKTPYAMVTTAHQMHRAARLRGALVVPADNRSKLMPYSKVVQLLRDLPITVAWCMPTEVLLWAAAAREAGLDPRRDFPHLRAFLVAGEAMSRAKRRRMSDEWGGKAVFQDYGSTETGSLGGECRHGAMHLWSDRLFFELYDERRRTTSLRGTGQLVVTTLRRQAMPLVRYLLEDAVRISETPCACGSPFPTIEVLGRSAAQIEVQGVAFYPVRLEEIVYSLPAHYGVVFWRARHDASSLLVEIEPRRGLEDEACDELAHEIFRELGVHAEVRCSGLEPLIPRKVLTERVRFNKPRFVFAAHEDWREGINYW